MQYSDAPTKTYSKLNHPPKNSSHEWRCRCGRLLFKGAFVVGIIEIKCPRCKRIVYLQEYSAFPSGRESFMAIVDLNGQISMVSKGVKDILGYQESDLVGKSLSELLQPEAVPSVGFWLDKIREISNTDNPHMVATIKFKHQDGNLVQIAFVAKSILLEGKPMVFIIVERDETALQRYSEQFIDSSTSSLRKQREVWDFIIQKDGQITESSGPSTLGYEQDALLKKSILEIFSESEKNNLPKLKEQLSAGKSFTTTAELIQSDGSTKLQDIAFTLDVLLEDQKDQYLVTFKNPEAHKRSLNPEFLA